MGILEQDTGAGSNAGAWGQTSAGGGTWNHLVGSAALSRSGGELRASNNNSTNLMVLGDGTQANQDVMVHLEQGDSGNFVGAVVRVQDSNNFYYADLGAFPGFMALGKRISGTFNDVDFFTFTYSATSKYVLKIRAVGSTIQAKVWVEGDPEPSSWGATMSDSSLSSGKYGIYANVGTTEALFDNIVITDTVSTINLLTGARAKYYTRSTQATEARAQFKILSLISLITQARSSFKVKAQQVTKARSHFLIPTQAILAPLKMAFSLLQQIAFSFSLTQSLRFSFSMNTALPNTTVVSENTVKDSNGNTLTDLSAATVVVTFPDGTMQSFSLAGNTITNAGAGKYTIEYATKGQGLIKEKWDAIAADGTTQAEDLNWIEVKY